MKERDISEYTAAEVACLKLAAESSRCADPLRVVISIAGPSGSGKTTITNLFHDEIPVYVEDASENPELQKLLLSADDFDSLRSQLWFLHRIEVFLKDSCDSRIVILDQDPLGVVLCYSRLFLRASLISLSNYSILVRRQFALENWFQRNHIQRKVMLLDASPEVLRSRAVSRSDGPVMPIEWFQDVRAQFLQLREHLMDSIPIDTTNLSAEQVHKIVYRKAAL